jgi:hypothetical protein
MSETVDSALNGRSFRVDYDGLISINGVGQYFSVAASAGVVQTVHGMAVDCPQEVSRPKW